MADKENKKTVSKKDSKPKATMRESAVKTRAKAEKPKRVRKAASAAVVPVGLAHKMLTRDRHVIPRKNPESFWHKSRKITPSYFTNAFRELRLVTWPKGKETWRLVLAVFIFAFSIGLVIALLDFGLEKAFRALIF